MNPKQIIFIRHGEKYNTETKRDEDVHLSKTGYKRADELINYFENKKPAEVNLPDYLIAMKQNKATTSNRCFETLEPLANNLKLTIETPYKRDDTKKLYKLLTTDKKYDNKVVLISWEHDNLVKLVKLFKVNVKYWGSTPLKKEEKYNFSSVWVLDNLSDFNIYPSFEFDINQNILYSTKLETSLYSYKIKTKKSIIDFLYF